jgi:hypothetical protein
VTTTYSYTNVLTVIECCTCHMDFAMPQDFVRDRRRDHAWWYCPTGHRQHYLGESDLECAERLRREAERRAERMDAAATHERDQREATERSLRATRGHLTRQRRRAAHGVCPCCSRTFANVATHVAKQHPDFVKAVTPAEVAP